ncbi:MAG: FAD-dependent monooxygenase [Anaerolineae bacterium]|nr:FAD-dependent monooxygenase [Anaerolineae bacterium]
MNILIVGAGIGGLTLAYWLKQYGHTPTVVEKAPDIRTAGYMIDFAGSGWDVANRMGIIPHLQAKSLPISQLVYVDNQGHTTARLSMERLLQAANTRDRYLALNRRDLVITLYEAIQHDVPVHFATSISDVCQSDSKVAVRFSPSGEEQDFDIVVGADGIHSNVRRLAFGIEAEYARYLGYYVAVFPAPAQPDIIEPGYVLHLTPNCQFGVLAVDPDQWLIYVVFKHDDEGHIPPESRLALLTSQLHQHGWLVSKVLDGLPPDTPIFMDTVTQIEMPVWSTNRVALIGDAAHCLTLISGQGAAMAMAGAYFLAEALHDAAEYRTAFDRYEARLRPHIERAQAKARRFAPNFIPSTDLRVALTTWAVRLMDIAPVAKLVGKQFSVESLLT